MDLPGAEPLSPTEALRSFRLADDQLVVELVASEPQVTSPVSMSWDHRGRLFVAEMRDYPNASTGGTIRLLEDRDDDGQMDSSVVFADGLAFPTSVLPWRDGVLVIAAPDILFLRDANGDGKADERHVMFSGLGTGNQQLRANGLCWGIDGWIHAANGRSDGSLRPMEAWRDGQWTQAGGPTTSIRGRDFRFDPSTGRVETVAGRSQFGLGLDDWGNRFLSWNTIPARHEVFPDHFLERNAATAGANVLIDMLPPRDPGEVHPLTPAPRVFNNESSSHFNALSGLHVFRGSALGKDYRGSLFMGESLRNLVHRRVIEPNDTSFIASAHPASRGEFLASTDPWFHPVAFGAGPDGALYMADFYREFVEHPDWVAKDMRTRVDWARGQQHGRIWRVRNRTMARHPLESFEGTPPSAWVQRLDSLDGWERDTAHRLLLGRRDPATVAPLHRLAREARFPEGRGHALRIAQQLARLPDDLLVEASRDPHPRVREQAAHVIGLELAAIRREKTATSNPTSSSQKLLGQALARLIRDGDQRVILAAALATGTIEDMLQREAILEELAASTTNAWIRLAAASSSSLPRHDWLPAPPTAAPMPAPPRPPNPAPDRQRVLSEFQPALSLVGDPMRGAQVIRQKCLACHVLHGHGQRIGPDLAGVAGKDPQTLLADILDPNRHVAPDHVAHELTARDGRKWTGLIASESGTRITLRFPGAPDLVLPRAEVASLRSTGRSLMPDGLEVDLTPKDMAGVISFLRQTDPKLLEP